MLIGQLPKTVDPRKLARQGMQFEGSLALNRFSRLVDALADGRGEVGVSLHFYQDEFGRTVLKGRLCVDCKMICQRCLDTADIPVYADILLMAVWTEKQAKALPADYDPLFLQEEPIELVPLLEDELLLALPLIPYHAPEACSASQSFSAGGVVAEAANELEEGAKTGSPFSVLAKLKTGAKTTI
ncbi:YceD family protein [Candidatus Sororendozoicomonas aggregata]|uniref:YceD family protein n=1 Tax=Candidatus Sororendozoicomonas aggregata TaxID=3073239 RepID=UPI002ED5E317